VAMGMGLVEIDRAGLEQVVTNLLVNALQAVRRGGTIWLSGSRAGKRYLIVVEDNGPGIPASVLPHIFDPFFTTKPTGEGTGLGLSVSLGIVEQYGGTLRASNLGDADDVHVPATGPARRFRGARFVIELPVSPPNGGVEARERPAADSPGHVRTVARVQPKEAVGSLHAAAPAPRAGATAGGAAGVVRAGKASEPCGASEPNGGGCRVLIIDDEEPIRRVVRRFLERRGCVVEDAADGELGLARLLDEARPAFDLILCDLNMPRLSGMALHTRLVQESPALTRGLVFSTGDTVAPGTNEFLSHTDRPVLEKPFELSKLGALLDDCILARS
jgi:CheY-like chemotaxis protein